MITRFFLYFISQPGAESAAAMLRERGFETSTGLGWDDPFWLTVAGRQLADADLKEMDEQMREFTATQGGDYGGYDQRPEPLLPAA